MGTPVPEDWPNFIPDKWYYVTLTIDSSIPPPPVCPSGIAGQTSRCFLGSAINDWILGGFECSETGLLIIGGFQAQKIKSWTGPYDTAEICNLR